VLSGFVEIRLYDETIEHVIDEHPEVPIELPSIQEAVTKAVTAPTHVEGSYNNSVVFVDANTTNRSGDPLRVPVKHVRGTSGRIKSVYFASTSGERNIIWRRGDE
jgi:hypothetical protein